MQNLFLIIRHTEILLYFEWNQVISACHPIHVPLRSEPLWSVPTFFVFFLALHV